VKHRLRLTVFAKLVITALILSGVRYVYLHFDGYIESLFENIKKNNDNIFPDDSLSDNYFIDTLTFTVISENDSLIFRSKERKIVVMPGESDTAVFMISKEKHSAGKFLFQNNNFSEK